MRLMPREPVCQIEAKAASAGLPVRGNGGDPDQDRQSGDAERAEERRQRRFHFQEAEADDQDRHQNRDHREHGQIARPGREAGHGLRLVGSGKAAGHPQYSIMNSGAGSGLFLTTGAP
jgi:hypothetical protein